MGKLFLAAAAGWIVIGCAATEPAFDPAVTEVHVIDGKKFAIPAGATPSAHIASRKEIDFYKQSGVSNCQYGDVIWDAKTAEKQIAEAIQKGNADIHKALAQKGLIGCASPLT